MMRLTRREFVMRLAGRNNVAKWVERLRWLRPADSRLADRGASMDEIGLDFGVTGRSVAKSGPPHAADDAPPP